MKPAVFTAIDEVLLDAASTRDSLQRLVDAGVPVVPVSTMTLEELAPIADDLGIREPMIIECGGAIARWSGVEWAVEPCAPAADVLLDVIREIEDRSGADLLVYSVLPEEEAARLSGRSGAMLRASTHRCFSEPFVIESGDFEAVQRAAAEIGFSIRRDGRFLHLCRECDEGAAFSRVRSELDCDVAVAIGASAIDAELLGRADVAIILPGPGGAPDPELLAKVPNARIAPGLDAAIEDVWESLGRRTAASTSARS